METFFSCFFPGSFSMFTSSKQTSTVKDACFAHVVFYVPLSTPNVYKGQIIYILFMSSLCSVRVFAGSSQYCENINKNGYFVAAYY